VVFFQPIKEYPQQVRNRVEEIYKNSGLLEKIILFGTTASNTLSGIGRGIYEFGNKEMHNYISDKFEHYIQNSIPHSMIFLETYIAAYMLSYKLSEGKKIFLSLAVGIGSQVSIEMIQLIYEGSNSEFFNDIITGVKFGGLLAVASYGMIGLGKINNHIREYLNSGSN